MANSCQRAPYIHYLPHRPVTEAKEREREESTWGDEDCELERRVARSQGKKRGCGEKADYAGEHGKRGDASIGWIKTTASS